MNIDQIFSGLDKFARNNSFLSIIILGIIGSFIYDVIKKTFRFFLLRSINGLKNTSKKLSKKKYENVKYLLEHYTQELEMVEKLKNNDKTILSKLIEDLYSNIVLIIILIIFLLLIDKFGSNYAFYGFLGASSIMVIRIVYQLYYNSQLFEKVKKFESYKMKIKKRTTRIEEILKNATNIN